MAGYRTGIISPGLIQGKRLGFGDGSRRSEPFLKNPTRIRLLISVIYQRVAEETPNGFWANNSIMLPTDGLITGQPGPRLWHQNMNKKILDLLHRLVRWELAGVALYLKEQNPDVRLSVPILRSRMWSWGKMATPNSMTGDSVAEGMSPKWGNKNLEGVKDRDAYRDALNIDKPWEHPCKTIKKVTGI